MIVGGWPDALSEEYAVGARKQRTPAFPFLHTAYHPLIGLSLLVFQFERRVGRLCLFQNRFQYLFFVQLLRAEEPVVALHLGLVFHPFLRNPA